MKHFTKIFILGLIVFFSSCKKDLPDPEIAPIDFGDIPFLKVGNYWHYTGYNDPYGIYSPYLEVEVMKQLPDNPNIFEVELRDSTSTKIQYWYGLDNGYLMIYDDTDDNEYQADPVYDITCNVGDIWEGVDRSTGKQFRYRVDVLQYPTYVDFGYVETTRLDVSSPNDIFFFQYNYWNDSLGLVKMSTISINYELDSAYINQ